MEHRRNTSGLMAPFQPGQSGNPSGRPKFRLTAEALRKIIDKYAFMTRTQLNAARDDAGTPAMELWILAMIEIGIKTGDYSRFIALLDRSIGKPAVEPADQVRKDLEQLTNEQLIARLEQDLKTLKSA